MSDRHQPFRMSLRTLTVAILIATPVLARAQVGYPPERSPYRDLEFKQGIAMFVGVFSPGRDEAKVAPRGGPMVGVRYDIRIGGPAAFTFRAAHAFSERTPVDPTQPAATRYLEKESVGLTLVDAGLTMNLTGQKSWHHLVPVLHGGVGIATAGQSEPDVGGFRFGTTFAFSFGTGVRWVPGGPFELRADLGDWLYQIRYPSSYFRPASDSTSVLGANAPDGVWKHNLTLTIGGSWAFWR